MGYGSNTRIGRIGGLIECIGLGFETSDVLWHTRHGMSEKFNNGSKLMRYSIKTPLLPLVNHRPNPRSWNANP